MLQLQANQNGLKTRKNVFKLIKSYLFLNKAFGCVDQEIL